MRRASASSFSYPLAGILFAGLEACLTSCETCAGGLEACLTGFEVCIGGLEACLTGVEIALTGLAASGLAMGFRCWGLTDSILSFGSSPDARRPLFWPASAVTDARARTDIRISLRM